MPWTCSRGGPPGGGASRAGFRAGRGGQPDRAVPGAGGAGAADGSGEAPDGRLFRVVGAEPSAALPEGVVARVVRAAVLRGDEILREGEVIVTRRSA